MRSPIVLHCNIRKQMDQGRIWTIPSIKTSQLRCRLVSYCCLLRETKINRLVKQCESLLRLGRFSLTIQNGLPFGPARLELCADFL